MKANTYRTTLIQAARILKSYCQKHWQQNHDCADCPFDLEGECGAECSPFMWEFDGNEYHQTGEDHQTDEDHQTKENE